MSQDQIIGADILLEFLEVAFHNILYARKLYPKEIFVKRKIYGTAVWVSEHPELNEYLNNVLVAVREMIEEDEKSVRSVALIFYNKNGEPVEKFIVDILQLCKDKSEKDAYFLKTEEALRTICLKLSMSESYLKPLPEDASFSVEIQTYDAARIGLNENPKCENFPWIEREDLVEMRNKDLLPLKTIATECLSVQTYIIEDRETKGTG